MNHVFVVNPHAGKTNSEADVRSKIEKAGLENVTVYLTQGYKDAVRFVKEWCEGHRDESNRFYACGGDGTLNEVVNGAVGFENVSVYPYPCGSGNDFVKYYGRAEDFLDLEDIAEAQEVDADLMLIGDEYAINTVNFGFEASVVQTMHKVRHKKLIGGKNSYTTGIVASLLRAMKTRCDVYADGEKLGKENMLLCSVANGTYAGGAYKCAPLSSNTDGLLEVGYVNPISRLKFVSLISYYKAGTHIGNPKFDNIVVYRRAKKVEVVAEKPISFCLDGELHESTRFAVEIVKHGIKVALPKKLALKTKETVTA